MIKDRLRVHTGLRGFQLGGEGLAKFVNIDLAIGRVSNDSHEGGLERLDLSSFGKEALKVIVDAGFLGLQLLALVL